MAFENCSEKIGRAPIKKQWLFAPLVTAVILLLILIIGMPFRGEEELLPVTEPSFTLNGKDYPLIPVLQDFIDRGWKRGKPSEKMGGWSEEGEPVNLVVTGYNLTSGKNRVVAYLDRDDVIRETEPGTCRLRSLSLYGENVDSFCIDGKELSKVDSSSIIDILGDPYKVDEEHNGKFYYYSMPEKSIAEIKFAFPNTLSTVAQIFIIFDIG